MIIEINKKDKEIIVHGNQQVVKVPFSKVSLLKGYMKDEKIKATQSVKEITYKQLLSITGAKSTQKSNNKKDSITGPKKTDVFVDKDKSFYIHSSKKGLVSVEGLKFHDEFDVKLIDMALMAKIKQSLKLQNLIKSGVLKIVNNQQRKILSQGKREKLAAQQEVQQKRDQQLDSILIDLPSVDGLDRIATRSSFDQMKAAYEIAKQQVDSNQGSNKPRTAYSNLGSSGGYIPEEGTFETMSDLLSALEGDGK